jgi:hypothetical protein
MKARSVTFFVTTALMPAVLRRIDEEFLPRFAAVAAFRGLVVLRSEGPRPEVVALSFWDEQLESSERISEEFRDEIERMTGATPARKEYHVSLMAMAGDLTEPADEA